MLIEDDPDPIREFEYKFSRNAPEVSLTVVRTMQEYRAHAGEPFGAYICDNRLKEQNGVTMAFVDILPDISRRFPGAVLIHSSNITGEKIAMMDEKMYRIRFARGADGKIVFCEKKPEIAIGFLRTMVADRDKSLKPPAQPAIPTPDRRKI